VLKHAGLVMDQASGTRQLYRLNPQGIDALRTYFQQFWSSAMATYREGEPS
jgi:hypothetical protein